MTDPSIEQKLRDYWSKYDMRIGRLQLANYQAHVSLANLPIDQSGHFRGFLIEERSLFGKWGEDWFSPPRSRGKNFVPYNDSVVCHVKPLSDPFAGVPDRWDLFLLLRWNFEKFGMRTNKETILISRTRDSWPAIEKLMNWEKMHPYRRSRLERLYPNASERERDIKYAESAMRGIQLKWPGKPNDRRKKWPDCVRALGLTVDIKPIPNPAKIVLKSDRSDNAQLSRFLNQGVDMLQKGDDFHATLKELGCTPSVIFKWLKQQRKEFPKMSLQPNQCTMEDLLALVNAPSVKDEKNA